MTASINIGAAYVGDASKQHLTLHELLIRGVTSFHFDVRMNGLGHVFIRNSIRTLRSTLPDLLLRASSCVSDFTVYLSIEDEHKLALTNYITDMRLRNPKVKYVTIKRPVPLGNGKNKFRDFVIQLYSKKALANKAETLPGVCIWTYKHRNFFLSKRKQSIRYNDKFNKFMSEYESLVSELDCVLMYHVVGLFSQPI